MKGVGLCDGGVAMWWGWGYVKGMYYSAGVGLYGGGGAI